jgi:hypothetical protein
VSDKTYGTLCAIAAIACFVVIALLWQPAPIPEEVWLQYKASHPQQNAGAITDRKTYDAHPPNASNYWFARQLRDIAKYCNQAPDSKVDEWVEKFVCEIKITDVAVARFTGILAIFTLALAVATGVLIVVGLSQASHLKSNVDVAADAAKEAKDAIKAIQTTAIAANIHAVAAEDANKINRDLLIATQRPWISAKLTIAGDLQYRSDGAAVIPITCALKNTGRTPAIFVWPHIRGVLQGPTGKNNAGLQRLFMAEIRQDGGISRQFGHTIFP